MPSDSKGRRFLCSGEKRQAGLSEHIHLKREVYEKDRGLQKKSRIVLMLTNCKFQIVNSRRK